MKTYKFDVTTRSHHVVEVEAMNLKSAVMKAYDFDVIHDTRHHEEVTKVRQESDINISDYITEVKE